MKLAQQNAIENYISSYNNFNVDGMLKDLDEEVVFENVSNGNVDMKLEGLDAFLKQAQAATSYFSSREQKVSSWDFRDDVVTIEINYRGVLAIELPNGMQPGDTLELKGKSTFTFNNGKISKIVDES